jgi:fumarate reductase flavoprotein subunit
MGIVRNINNYSFDTDIVVVGSGGCGLTAAIAAAQGDAEVLVFEKQTRPWSNTARSGGMIPAAGTRFQQDAGIHETPETFAADILRKNHHTSNPDMTLHLARTATGMVEWLVDEVGVDLVFIDDFKYPGHSQYRMHAPPSRTGAALVKDLRRAVENHVQAELITDASVSHLVAGEDDSITGVVVRHGAQEEQPGHDCQVLSLNVQCSLLWR